MLTRGELDDCILPFVPEAIAEAEFAAEAVGGVVTVVEL